MQLEKEYTPFHLPTAETIRRQLLDNINLLERNKVSRNIVAAFDYYRDSLRAQYLLDRYYREHYSNNEPSLLNKILETETGCALCEIVFAAWLSITPQQREHTAEYAQEVIDYLSVGLLSSYPVPILYTSAYYARLRLSVDEDPLPSKVVEDTTDHAVRIVSNIFQDQKITKGKLLVASALADHRRRQQIPKQLPT